MANIGDVKDFWERNLCLDKFLKSEYLTGEYFKESSRLRYKYHYHIPAAIKMLSASKPGGKTLEIGVGMGDDTLLLCQNGFDVTGIDLTEKSIEATSARLNFHNLSADLKTGDAEELEFDDETFDIVYSFGVLHHSPDTPKTVSEVHRVLKKDGIALIMLYHKRSLNYLMHRVTNTSFDGSKDDPCPEEKAYQISEIKNMFVSFSSIEVQPDYLFGTGWKWVNYLVPVFVKKFWARWFGWHLMIWATK